MKMVAWHYRKQRRDISARIQGSGQTKKRNASYLRYFNEYRPPQDLTITPRRRILRAENATINGMKPTR